MAEDDVPSHLLAVCQQNHHKGTRGKHPGQMLHRVVRCQETSSRKEGMESRQKLVLGKIINRGQYILYIGAMRQ